MKGWVFYCARDLSKVLGSHVRVLSLVAFAAYMVHGLIRSVFGRSTVFNLSMGLIRRRGNVRGRVGMMKIYFADGVRRE